MNKAEEQRKRLGLEGFDFLTTELIHIINQIGPIELFEPIRRAYPKKFEKRVEPTFDNKTGKYIPYCRTIYVRRK